MYYYGINDAEHLFAWTTKCDLHAILLQLGYSMNTKLQFWLRVYETLDFYNIIGKIVYTSFLTNHGWTGNDKVAHHPITINLQEAKK